MLSLGYQQCNLSLQLGCPDKSTFSTLVDLALEGSTSVFAQAQFPAKLAFTKQSNKGSKGFKMIPFSLVRIKCLTMHLGHDCVGLLWISSNACALMDSARQVTPG